MGEALSAGEGGVKIRPELMADEVLYHCVYGGKIILVYRDGEKILHCYEIADPAAVAAVESCQTYDEAARKIEEIAGAR